MMSRQSITISPTWAVAMITTSLLGCGADATDGPDGGGTADTTTTPDVPDTSSAPDVSGSDVADTTLSETSAPTGQCQGTAEACSEFSTTGRDICVGQLGCTYDANGCDGVAAQCSSQSGATCARLEGCQMQDGVCTGSSQICPLYDDSFSCAFAPGCFWTDPECEGTPFSCASWTDVVDCVTHFGCTWVDDE